MSHVDEIKCSIDDLESLRVAAESLGLELVRDQKTFRWYGRHVGDHPLPQGFTKADMGVCEHAIRIPGNKGAYEVGVVKRRDGRSGYTLLYDHYAGGQGMTKVVGDKACGKLVQAYAAERVRKAARRTHRVRQQTLKDGTIKLTLTRS